MHKSNEQRGEIVIFRTKEGAPEIQVRLEAETLWLSQRMMAQLFDKDSDTIGLHLRNIYTEGELDEKSTTEFFSVVQREGNRQITRSIKSYNLDAIISVGYRVNSKRGTQFRIWATNVLRDHLVRGYTLNRKALQRTHAKVAELQKTIELITSVRDKILSTDEAQGLLTVIKQYADTWTTLEAYDSGKLQKRTSTRKARSLSYEEAREGIARLKQQLMQKGEAGNLFAVERNHGLDQVIGAVNQTFGGKDLYPSVEEKAAHLLYFVIKDHPFSDGNKRSGSFLFLHFLQKNTSLTRKSGEAKISDTALTALALLIAESKPNEKDRMIALITNLLRD